MTFILLGFMCFFLLNLVSCYLPLHTGVLTVCEASTGFVSNIVHAGGNLNLKTNRTTNAFYWVENFDFRFRNRVKNLTN